MHNLSTTRLFIVGLVLLFAGRGSADEIRIGSIPITGIEVRDITPRGVSYLFQGQPQTRALDGLRLHLDAIPQVKEAEDAVDRGETTAALALLTVGLELADDPVSRRWILFRRMIILDDAGRFTEAAGEWATLYLDSRDAGWARYAPVSPDDTPIKSVAQATYERLEEASEVNASTNLRSTLRDLLERVDAIRATAPLIAPAVPEESERQTDDPSPDAIEPTDATPDVSPTETESESKSANPIRPTRTETTESSDGRSASIADRIDRALELGEYDEAERLIRDYVERPRRYPLDRLLYQYGQLLEAQNDTMECLRRYMQCAILYPESHESIRALARAARVYGVRKQAPDIARRLLELAESRAKTLDDHAGLSMIERTRAELNL